MNVAEILRQGADRIEQYGWWRKGTGGEPNAVVLPDGRVALHDEPVYLDHSINCECVVTSVKSHSGAVTAIMRHLSVSNVEDVTALNDQQPLASESRTWAITLLRRAADDVERREREAVSA